MKNFCPFIRGNCDSECVFWIPTTLADTFTETNCRLVSAAGQMEYMGKMSSETIFKPEDDN